MTPRERNRRVGILCLHCLRNIAFYRGGYRRKRFCSIKQFWINANGNFLDIAVPEWCKLFADARGKHHYAKIIMNPTNYRQAMLEKLAISDADFDEYVKEMKTYRDKFVAHLDDERTMMIPRLSIAKKSTKFLYKTLLAQESATDTFHDAPTLPSKFYKDFEVEARREYEAA